MCCNNANILNEVLEGPKDTEDDTCSLEYIDAKDDELTEEELLALGSCVARYFESSNSPESEESCLLDLDSILGGVDFSDDLAKPGDDFDLHLLLKSSKHPRNESRPLVEDVNAVIDLVASHKHYAAYSSVFSGIEDMRTLRNVCFRTRIGRLNKRILPLCSGSCTFYVQVTSQQSFPVFFAWRPQSSEDITAQLQTS